ncbi:protein induced by osmotic stress [Scheffersomyces coipomensis]|uniref:protein induced by osmotic stress n=1 Tax=Scheffersomyces coipomensis TaxID=1788519 RepID=UPI00315DF5D4
MSAASKSSLTAFVSGANGYIAAQLIDQLLHLGYSVIGSVRSADKGDYLVKNFNSSHFKYEIVPVLEKEGAFDEALTKHPNVSVFFHTASPVLDVSTVTNPEAQVLAPAINGTKNVLASIKKSSPQVERVVFTSSIVATWDRSQGIVRATEETWNPVTYEEAVTNKTVAYSASKTYAERAAWDFLTQQKPNFTLSVINPVYVLGPQTFNESVNNLNMTAKLVTNVLDFKPNEPIPALEGRFIDVRDVAKAHILASQKDEAQGKRFILVADFYNNDTLVNIIRKNFPELQSKLPVVEKEADVSINMELKDDNARNILNIDYISLETSVVDSVKQYLTYKKDN